VTLANIRAGLKTAYETVPGIGPVLMYPPKSIPANYTLFTGLNDFEVTRSGQVRAIRWGFTSRLVILWQDAENAEAQLDAMVEAIIDAVDADAHLGGALASGIAQITAGDADWFSIAGSEVVYRYVDFAVKVLEK